MYVIREVPVATIFENLEAGASLDDILEWYDGLVAVSVEHRIQRSGLHLGGGIRVHAAQRITGGRTQQPSLKGV